MEVLLTSRGPGGSYESDGSLAPGTPEDYPVSQRVPRSHIGADCSQCQAATGKGGSGQVYGGVFTSLKRMWQQEGFAGFMKGNGINVVRVSS